MRVGKILWKIYKMKKPFLLIAGPNYYPAAGTNDWKNCYETYEEAMKQVKSMGKGGDIYYEVDNETCGWYEIVDLRNWTEEDGWDWGE